ncbi:MAG: hypothetical protein R2792_01625 [Saprospiraceae bacterium]
MLGEIEWTFTEQVDCLVQKCRFYFGSRGPDTIWRYSVSMPPKSYSPDRVVC